MPEGTYRLHVTGHTYIGSNTTYPWDTDVYELDSPEFEVVPGDVTVTVGGDGTVSASLHAPDRGYRLVGLDGDYRGDNPLPEDTATITLTFEDGSTTTSDVTGTRGGHVTSFSGVLTEGAVSVTVTDIYGNTGTVSL